MDSLRPSPPFVWPEPRVLEGSSSYADVPIADLAKQSRGLFGTVSAINRDSVKTIQSWIRANRDLNARLVVAVYPACATRSDDLTLLRHLEAEVSDRLEVRIRAYDSVTAHPLNAICFIGSAPDTVYIATGPTEGLGFDAQPAGKANFAVRADAGLTEAFKRYCDWLRGRSRPISTAGITDIPRLEIPPGTAEGAALWRRYCDGRTDSTPAQETVEVAPDTGVVRLVGPANVPVTPPTEAVGLASLDDLAETVARLYEKGSLVSIDKLSRLPPLDAPLNPGLVGDVAELQRGTVTRRVTMRVSLIDKKTLKEIEKRRTAVRELLDTLSFGLGENMRWMPNEARPLFEAELNRTSTEGRQLITDLLRGDLDAFVSARLPALKTDPVELLRDRGGEAIVTDSALNQVATSLKERLQKASTGKFVPTLTYSRVGFRPSSNEWTSPWGQASALLADIAAFPRRALTDGFLLRAVKVPKTDVLSAMNVADDAVLQAPAHSLRDRCRAESDLLARLTDASIDARDRCEFAWRIIRGDRLDALARDLRPEPEA